ncbi:MAG: peptidylprolyl isomerase, partial [Oscillibacter sp.]|nr:peptidylprolyl isomerase [Oscillibacter sp.]
DNSKINYVSNDSISYSSGSTLSEWLFDSARRSGDSAVLENGSTYYVAVFHDRFRDETKTIDVRHILIQPEAGTLSEGDEGYEAEQERLQSAAKAKAEELYAQWQAGEATEESFSALAMEESADGSRYDGGLYTQVYQGQMVTEFNDWCFDPARKSGDTGIVETTYGYHIMYFVGDDLPYWQVQVSDTLKSDAYSQWLESLSDGASIQRHDFGMRFVA